MSRFPPDVGSDPPTPSQHGMPLNRASSVDLQVPQHERSHPYRNSRHATRRRAFWQEAPITRTGRSIQSRQPNAQAKGDHHWDNLAVVTPAIARRSTRPRLPLQPLSSRHGGTDRSQLIDSSPGCTKARVTKTSTTSGSRHSAHTGADSRQGHWRTPPVCPRGPRVSRTATTVDFERSSRELGFERSRTRNVIACRHRRRTRRNRLLALRTGAPRRQTTQTLPPRLVVARGADSAVVTVVAVIAEVRAVVSTRRRLDGRSNL